MHDGVNERLTLNRKKLREGIDGALKRFGLDYIDLVYCHRPDPETPVEEIVWSMHTMVDRGQALYWGASEWNADQLVEAWQLAQKHHLHPPQVEQPQYNLFVRRRAHNGNVSSVITGASRPEPVKENMKAMAILPKISPEVMDRIEGAIAGTTDASVRK
jgi:aryl-alcohol dehydrogenase-like predicted oxidoreductase